ncbi:MAG: hypothetical protein WAZ14_00510 [Patescibacteria group bacterium]
MRVFAFLKRHKFIFASVFAVALLALATPGHFALAQVDLGLVDTGFAYLVLVLANLMISITSFIGTTALSLIEMLVVPILQYNNFSSSPTIGMGWALVRDVVNMFVVLVLLVIAMATIIGYEKVNWQKNLPQFLLAVILVNFSRTICGLLIDFSQVIMFTFVNSLLDVAAGNFANLTGITDFGQYSNSAARNPDGSPSTIDAVQQLGAAYLLFILYVCIFAVLLLLALVYIWRIIMLWVLVIMSPLTFFTWGLGGMFSFAAGATSDWWKKFTSALIIGPMLTFFLWLALATGSGDILASEGFEAGEPSVSGTLVSLETSGLLSTFLGLALLVVGMQQSAATASSMGGLAQKALGDEKLGQKLIGGAIRYTGGGLVQRAGTEVGYTAKRAGVEGIRTTSDLGIKLGQTVAERVPIVGGAIGRQMINTSGAVQQRAEGVQKEGRVASQKRLGAMTDSQKSAHLSLLAADKKFAITSSARDDIANLQLEVATNKNLRKENKSKAEAKPSLDANGLNQNDRLNIVALKDSESKKGDLDENAKKNVATFKTEQAHLLDQALGKGELRKHIQSDKFNGRDLSKEAVADEDVIAQLKDRVVRTKDDGAVVTAHEELMNGAYGKDLAEAAKRGSRVAIGNSSPDAQGPTIAKLKPQVTNKSGEVVDVERAYTPAEIASNIESGNLQPDKLKVEDIEGPNSVSVTKAIIDTDSISKLSTSVRDAVVGVVNSLPKNALSTVQRANVDKSLLDSGSDPVQIGLMPSDAADGGMLNAEMHLRIEQMVKTEPLSIRHLQSGLPQDSSEQSDIADTIIDNLQADGITKLGQRALTASGQDLADIKATLATVGRAIQAQYIRAETDKSVNVSALEKAHRAASRYIA